MRGRRPDNPAVQEAKGNPSKRAKRSVGEVPEAAELDDGAPQHLSKDARALWSKLAPELVRLRFVRHTDHPSLERYCEALADYWKIQRKLRGKERTYWTDTLHGKMKRVDPLFLVMQRVEDKLFAYEDRIGLNPQARQRILLGMAAGQGMLPLNNPTQNQTDGEKDQPGTSPTGADSPIGFLAGRMH